MTQALSFLADTQALAERMAATGPGVPGKPLPDGLMALKAFSAEVEELVKQRDAIRLAEQLFDMDQSSYPALSQVRCSRTGQMPDLWPAAHCVLCNMHHALLALHRCLRMLEHCPETAHSQLNGGTWRNGTPSLS
jgi:hypothetical protein